MFRIISTVYLQFFQIYISKQLQMSKFDNFNQNLEILNQKLTIREEKRKEKKNMAKDKLHEVFDTLEEKNNLAFSKIEDLNRKATIVISVGKILPEIPENFPKNYHIQVLYEDVLITGNQKFVDFDENIIDEKFILPLLASETIKIEIWAAEVQPSLFDKGFIQLQIDIEKALELNQWQGSLNLSLSDITLSYTIQLQGIGFRSWLKNLKVYSEIEEERKALRKEQENKRDEMRQKLENKKINFSKNFGEGGKKTEKYEIEEIDDILQSLQN